MAKQRPSVAEFIASGKSSGGAGTRIEFAEFYAGSGFGGGVWSKTDETTTPSRTLFVAQINGQSRIAISSSDGAVFVKEPLHGSFGEIFFADSLGLSGDGVERLSEWNALCLFSRVRDLTLVFGSGQYILDTTQTPLSLTTSLIGKSVNSTEIHLKNTGLMFTSTLNGSEILRGAYLSNMTIIPLNSNISRAVSFIGNATQDGTQPAGSPIKPSPKISDVVFRGRYEYMPGHPDAIVSGGGTRHFENDYVTDSYIYCFDCNNPVFESVSATGSYEIGEESQSFASPKMFTLDGSTVEATIINSNARSCLSFMDAIGTTEGFFVDNCTSIYCRDGIVANTTDVRPGGFIDNFYCANSRYGVWLNNRKDFQIGKIQMLRSSFYRDETEFSSVKIENSEKGYIDHAECRPVVSGFTGVISGVLMDASSGVTVSHIISENSANIINLVESCSDVTVLSAYGVNCTTGYRVGGNCDDIHMPRNISGSITNLEAIDSSSFVNRGTAIGWGTVNATETITGSGTDLSGIKDANFKRMRFTGTNYTFEVTPSTNGAVRGDLLKRNIEIDSATTTVNINDNNGTQRASLTGPASYAIEYIYNNSNWVVSSIGQSVA